MNQFLKTTIRWIIPGIALCLAFWFVPFLVNDNADRSGLIRFKPVQCNSMILGTSRSAQGVNPAILTTEFIEGGEWFNFSFNLSSSPWIKAYTRAILSKIECSITEDSPGHFLLFVDPWSMDELAGQGINSFMKQPWFNPCSLGHGKWKFIQHTSNPLSVIGGGSGTDLLAAAGALPSRILSWFEEDYAKKNGIDANGWLPYSRMKTAARVNKDITSQVKWYRKNKHRGNQWPGSENEEALISLIHTIQASDESAQIILVRPPVTDAMLALEMERFPELNDWMRAVSLTYNIPYLDTNERWGQRNNSQFNDAHHLNEEGANEFSHFLAAELNQILN